MKDIASFTIDHTKLVPGVYVSRLDTIGTETITTFDLRFTRPNIEPALENAPIHAIEHLGATFLRNSSWADKIIYFGPMGCRTGFYLILAGRLQSKDIIALLQKMCSFILEFTGAIPGATAEGCGNYQDINLATAKYHIKTWNRMLHSIDKTRTKYPH
ncbi:MAG TPA: S-ribosylhomocysteine lyase [Treponemataceae bacterium]|nr:S-ribosylhomocysteine lyase [Treponemataceae bacterium]